MPCFQILLLLSIALLAITNSVSEALDRRDAAPPGFLRARDNDEERETITDIIKPHLSSLKLPGLSGATREKLQKLVFRELNLHHADDELFKRKRFLAWFGSLKLLYGENTEKVAMLILNSIHHYDDEMLAKMIVKAKQSRRTKRIATKLQKEQLASWKSQEKAGGKVFNWLQLEPKLKLAFEDKTRDLSVLFTDPEFLTWKEYVTMITTNTEEANELMIKTLTASIGDDRLAKLLIASKSSKQLLVSENAIELQKAQLKYWLVNHVAPKDAHGWMGIQGKGHNALERKLWGEYRKDYNARYITGVL